ncbi:MAG: Fur family transcriptional regulator, partial [Abditibacteriota bacterium]|nr:Fur family transcriptional regulator [Abditibacteriota bacterium]
MTKSGITLTSSLEDYLEAIYNLKIMFPEVRMKDIADRVSVRMPAAT